MVDVNVVVVVVVVTGPKIGIIEGSLGSKRWSF